MRTSRYHVPSLDSRRAYDADPDVCREIASERWFETLSASPSKAHRRLAAAIVVGAAKEKVRLLKEEKRLAALHTFHAPLPVPPSFVPTTWTRRGEPLEWLRNNLLHAFVVGAAFSSCGIRRQSCDRPKDLAAPERHPAACRTCQENAYRHTTLQSRGSQVGSPPRTKQSPLRQAGASGGALRT